MSLPGPLSLPPIQAQDLTNLSLQVQERISAEVLQVAGDRVYLSINGVQVVARLTSSDQASRLMERRQASFIVKDSSQNEILLQLVGTQTGQDNTTADTVGIIPELLDKIGLPADPENILLTQLFLKHSLPVNRDVIQAVRDYFQAQGDLPPTSRELSAAVALLARGLPLSPGTLALISQDLSPLGEILDALIKQLRGKAQSAKPSLRYLYAEAAGKLSDLFIPAGESVPTLTTHLQHSLSLLGETVEGQLKDRLQDLAVKDYDLPQVNDSSLSLAVLLGIFDQEEPDHSPLKRFCSDLLNRLRQTQAANAAVSENNPQSQWLEVELPVILADQQHPGPTAPAILKIHARGASRAEQEQSQMVHFNLTIQLGPEQILSAEFTIHQKKIQGEIKSSSDQLQKLADQELPDLKTRLNQQGFTVNRVHSRLDPEITLQSELSVESEQVDQAPHHLAWKKLNLEA